MKRILSGITPSGDGSLHIGNYLGAVKQFVELSKDHECFLMFADLHALTTIQQKKTLRQNIETLILNEIALVSSFAKASADKGNFENIYFFRQSDVPLHTELQSILNNVTPLGLIKRAHAYKDKLAKDMMEDDINLGLFNYPVLMAADILLYKPHAVPVGKDQKQHIEITRDIAQKFNSQYQKQLFVLPEPYIPEDVAVVMGTDGQRKMSKSLGNIISIFESEETIRKQVNSCFTDPTRAHATDPGHVEGNMVFTYLDFFGQPADVTRMKQEYKAGKLADVVVKDYLYQSLLTYFGSARQRFQELKEDPKKVQTILEKGTAMVGSVAVQTMHEVREVIGLNTSYSFFQYPSSNPTGSLAATRDDGFITIDQFTQVQQRVGKVLEATHPEKSEKLIRLKVDFGTESRIIFTGVRQFGYTKDDFIGKQFFFVTNLMPRKMMGEESQGMIMAVDAPSSPGLGTTERHAARPIFISADGMPLGATIR